jgi:hypothetical protein
MKNKFKLFGIIALLAVIGFSMVACSGDSQSQTVPMLLKKYGINVREISNEQGTFEYNRLV